MSPLPDQRRFDTTGEATAGRTPIHNRRLAFSLHSVVNTQRPHGHRRHPACRHACFATTSPPASRSGPRLQEAGWGSLIPGDVQKVVNSNRLLFANERMLDSTEAPAQSRRAFNSAIRSTSCGVRATARNMAELRIVAVIAA